MNSKHNIVVGLMRRLLPLCVLFFTLHSSLFTLSSCSTVGLVPEENGIMDWTMYRGDAALSGYTAQALPEQPTLLWSYKTGKRTVSSPIVLNGTTYWCDTKGCITGVDLTGEQVFQYDMQTQVEATPLIRDSILYIGRTDGFLNAISLSRADALWTFETLGQISATPNIVRFKDQEAIVFGSYDNDMYCVARQTGREISHFPSGYYINGAAAVWDHYVVFGGCDQLVRVIDCETGEQTDSLLLDSYVPASPAIRDGRAYIADYGGDLYEITMEDGKISDSRKLVTATDDEGGQMAVPAVSDRLVVAFADGRYLKAFNRKDGKEQWKYLMKGTLGESSPLIANDQVIACTKTGVVTILDSETGEQKWEYDTGEQIVGSPAVIEGHFLILTAKGTLLCFGTTN